MTHRIARISLPIACLLLVVLPMAAPAQEDTGFESRPESETMSVPPSLVGKHNSECKRITRQIARYAEQADLARERGNENWEQGTLDHIERLATRRAQLCPTLYAQKPIGAELAKMLKGAAKIATKLFTMGML
jgi:hypothetical protein